MLIGLILILIAVIIWIIDWHLFLCWMIVGALGILFVIYGLILGLGLSFDRWMKEH